MSELPLIDLSGCDPEGGDYPGHIVAAVEQACTGIGFMLVRGHGVDATSRAALRDVMIQYFALPLAEKQRLQILPHNYRGYIPRGFFSANSGDREVDGYEGFKLHTEVSPLDPVCAACDLYGPNRWPEVAGFREAVEAYWASCDRLAAVLLRMLATVLEVDAAQFLDLFDKPLTNMTLLHYPAPDQGGDAHSGIHAHKDTDVLTILAPDPAGGLLVKRRGGGGWIEAQAPADALIVNTGDMLELWSGGRIVSTPHKVVHSGQHSRYSFPYFVVPRHDTVVQPLLLPPAGFGRQPVHVGAVSREVWRTNWPDARPGDSGFDLGTLAD